MNIHIIGICGTFMGGVARLACDLGMQVSGSDANTYPPMSTQLQALGVKLFEGYRADNIKPETDIVIVGNAISRGNPELEQVLDIGLRYTSGAQWLRENVLHQRWVLAIAGTHGKTTTASLLAWLLHDNGLAPGFLIGGVPENFDESARLGETPFFVIEADEYDTAFCDKRSKFVHYHPRTLVLNNLEFDHADIFADLAAIQTQFHHLIRTVPRQGKIIYNRQSVPIDEVMAMGVWSETETFGLGRRDNPSGWWVEKQADDASRFTIGQGDQQFSAEWNLIGDHNMLNALAAVAAAHHVGLPIEHAVHSLRSFQSVKRRMEKIFDNGQVSVFDDFAHHPTAIRETLTGLRHQVGDQPIIAVLEPRSNTMKRGIHKHLINEALQSADSALVYADTEVQWDARALQGENTHVYDSTSALLTDLQQQITQCEQRCHVLIMSNGGFENLYQRLLNGLKSCQ